MTRLLTRRQVAAMISMSAQSVPRLAKRGLLPRPIHFGRTIRWSEEAILEFIRQLSQAPAQRSHEGLLHKHDQASAARRRQGEESWPAADVCRPAAAADTAAQE